MRICLATSAREWTDGDPRVASPEFRIDARKLLVGDAMYQGNRLRCSAAAEMTTRLPFAEIGALNFRVPGDAAILLRQKSIAKWIPESPRPGTLRSRGCSAPIASRTAS